MDTVSVIVPIYNSKVWIESLFESILAQTYQGPLEICVWDDSSSDGGLEKVEEFESRIKQRNWRLKTGVNQDEGPHGPGEARNRAIERLSEGNYICIQDSDDLMLPNRIERQLLSAKECGENYLIGAKVIRDPPDSTKRYTKWLNTLPQKLLATQIFTSHGPTICQPTWFFHRSLFERQERYIGKRGDPEDQIFFLRHVLEFNGQVYRVEEPLVIYRMHDDCMTNEIDSDTMWHVRLQFLERYILSEWPHFSIWSAGKQGRKLFRSLSPSIRDKVKCFGEVSEKKIGGVYENQLSKKLPKPKVPIVHYSELKAPILVAVKTDLHKGGLEENIKSLNLTENFKSFIHIG